MKTKKPLENPKVNVKIVIASAWAAMMALYIYCDYFSLYRPGHFADIAAGKMGFMAISQASLFSAGILMAIPALMILMSVLLPARANRPANCIASCLYILVNFGNLVGETWIYYIMFGVLELAIAVYILVSSIRWPRSDAVEMPACSVHTSSDPSTMRHSSSEI